MAARSAGYGVPGILALARSRYEARRQELLRSGADAREIDTRILDEAREDGGTLKAGEHINLSLWSERFAIARPVLEAIVLSIHKDDAPPSAPHVIAMPAEADDDIPITPPPRAMRHPMIAVPPSVDSAR